MGTSFKLKESTFRLDLGRKSYTVGVGRDWNRLSREVVDVSALEIFKAKLYGDFNTLV